MTHQPTLTVGPAGAMQPQHARRVNNAHSSKLDGLAEKLGRIATKDDARRFLNPLIANIRELRQRQERQQVVNALNPNSEGYISDELPGSEEQ